MKLLFFLILLSLMQLCNYEDLCGLSGFQGVHVSSVSEGTSPNGLGDGMSCYPLNSEQRTASLGVLM